MKMLAKEIRAKTVEELKTLLDETSFDYFKLKMQLTTGQLPTHRKIRESRKSIALIKTIINEKRLDDGTN
jgi:large subunit ribosomal protein L29